jgi:hypothetical protein
MRESRTYGSVRGALSNERPYRVLALLARHRGPVMAHCGGHWFPEFESGIGAERKFEPFLAGPGTTLLTSQARA